MRSQENHRQFVFFLAGFLLGVLYIYFSGDYKGEGTDFFSIQNLVQIRYTEVVYEEYFVYLLKKRVGVLLVLGVLSLALAGKYLLSGFLMLFGCCLGSMLSVLIMRYGLSGMLLFAGLVFPQNFIYIPAVFGWVALLTEWNEGVFGRRKTLYRKGYGRGAGIKQILVLCGVTIIGILLECYVNPVVVNWCLKIF